MRVCQPAPVALKAAITSGERRMVVACLVGAFCDPRGLIPIALSNSGGNTWATGLKRRRSAAVSLRTSPFTSVSGARLVKVFYLTSVGFTKADDANALE